MKEDRKKFRKLLREASSKNIHPPLRYRYKIHEWGIIQILKEANHPLTTQEVADYGQMNWSTARKCLESLVEKGIVSKKKGEKAILWSGSESGGSVSLRGNVQVG